MKHKRENLNYTALLAEKKEMPEQRHLAIRMNYYMV